MVSNPYSRSRANHSPPCNKNNRTIEVNTYPLQGGTLPNCITHQQCPVLVAPMLSEGRWCHGRLGTTGSIRLQPPPPLHLLTRSLPHLHRTALSHHQQHPDPVAVPPVRPTNNQHTDDSSANSLTPACRAYYTACPWTQPPHPHPPGVAFLTSSVQSLLPHCSVRGGGVTPAWAALAASGHTHRRPWATFSNHAQTQQTPAAVSNSSV